MSLPIFPLSPLPVNLTRLKDWGEDVDEYDSGESQGFTSFVKPLYNYSISIKVMNELKQSSLWAFQDTTRGRTSPFLMKDPYDYRVNSVLAVRSGISTGTLFFYDTNSFMVRADTTTVGSLFSALSGYVTLGVEYNYAQDTGIVSIVTKSNTDTWGVRSMQYWKKARFGGPWRETSLLWNLFAVDQIPIREMP